MKRRRSVDEVGQVSRRGLLRAAGVSVVALFCPTGWRPGPAQAEAPPIPRRFVGGAYLFVAGSGRLGVVVDKSEMGQGVTSLFTVLAAEQLESDPRWLELAFADVDPVYTNDKLVIPLPSRLLEAIGFGSVQAPFQMTALSTSTADAWRKLPTHARGVYALLTDVAVREFGLGRGAIRLTEFGVESGGQSVPFSSLVSRLRTAGSVPTTATPRLRQLRWVGVERADKPASLVRPDVVEKVLGTAKFASDVAAADFGAPAMYSAVVVWPDERGARVAPVNPATVMRLSGVRQVFTLASGVGVAIVADTYWQARQAAERLEVREFSGPNRDLSDGGVRRLYRSILEGRGAQRSVFGDELQVRRRLGRAGRRLRAEYSVPYAPHMTMEPMTASAQYQAGRLVVFAGTQFPDAARALAAQKARVPEDRVDLRPCYLGGGFGRRLYSEHIELAVEIAQQTRGVPVKLTYSREDDLKNDFFRPMALHRVEAGFDGAEVKALRHDLVTQSVNAFLVRDHLAALTSGTGFSGLGRRLLNGKQLDAFSHEGAEASPYRVGEHALVSHQPVSAEVPQMPVGFWRSVGHSHTAFAKECFVDELADAMGEDPWAWRLARSRDPAEANCLRRLASMVAPADRSRFGVALHSGWGSHCAMAARVELVENRGARVREVRAVVDCGFVVQPDEVRAQVEGAIVFGLSAALKQEIGFEHGVVRQSNFYDIDVLRMFEAPDIVVDIVEHPPSRAPTGVGELGVPPVAPAVANALYRETGLRVRDLPITWERIVEARQPSSGAR